MTDRILMIGSINELKMISGHLKNLCFYKDQNPKDYDFYIIFDIASYYLEFIKNNPHKTIIHDSAFSKENYLSHDEYHRLYYANVFEAVITNTPEVLEVTLYSQILINNENLAKNVHNLKCAPGLRINEHILLTNHANKHFNLRNVPLYSRYQKISFKKYSLLSMMPSWSLNKYLIKHKVDRVILNLPYRHLLKIRLLNQLKKLKQPYLITERGALPKGLIFDDHDFNYNSKYYSDKYWQRNYNQQEIEFSDNLTKEIIAGSSLEAQTSLDASESQLSHIQKLANGRKIIFVPLQRPFDSVIRYFCPKGYNNFVKTMIQFAEMNKTEYYVIFKKHPLEKKWPKALRTYSENKALLKVDFDVHVNDLIKTSHAVALINSGVGVVSMVFKKPVFHYGNVFYKVPGCNASFSTASDLKNQIEKLGDYNHVDANKFINYLYNDYYTITELKPVNYSFEVVHDFKNLRIPELNR